MGRRHQSILAFILTMCTSSHILGISSAYADQVFASTLCFEFLSHDTPERIPDLFLQSSSESIFETQVWCYSQVSPTELFIFNNDEPEVRPEMSLLIDSGVKGKTTFAQGSRAKGQLSLVKSTDPGFSPFGVPLSVDEATQNGANQVQLLSSSSATVLRAQELINQLREVPLKKSEELAIANFTEHDELDANLYPYDAYWWPHSGVPLGAGDHSPLGKYDRASQARTGRNPGAASWERQQHSLQNVAWGGHCNGWAASSILYDKWATRVWDEQIQTVILPSDVDGIRAEASFCVDWAFYGARYRTSSDDISDIHADRFHKVLRYYLRNLKKPIAIDYVVDESVDNNVITGYRSVFTEIPSRPGWYEVQTELQMHRYDSYREEVVRPAETYTLVYRSRVQLDAQRNILAGEWVDDWSHPDFMWVPLAQKKCGRENPAINHLEVETWLSGLPPAQRQTVALNLSIQREIPPNSEVVIPLQGPLVGTGFQVEFGGSGYNETLVIRARGAAAQYPHLSDQSPFLTGYYSVGTSPTNINFEVTNMDALVIVNSTGRTLRATSPLVIKGVSFWGAPTQGATH